MNPFDLSPEDFNLFLAEEAQYRSPAEIDDLRRRYRDANSLAGFLQRSLAPEEGRRRATYAPVDAPQGMSIWDAITSGEAGISLPQGLVDMLAGGVRAVESPAEYAMGIPPRADALGDAFNTAGMAMLGGGAVARPAGSLGSNNIYGNTVDFTAFKKARAKEDFLGKVKAVVDDVSSGAYQARIDQYAFDLHKSGNLPLPVGTRVSPPSSYEMGNDLRISGYWVDPQDANVFGYKLQNDAGEEFREFVNNPRLGIGSRSADRFGGGFKAFAGPNADDRFGFSAPSSSVTQTAAREPIPDSVQKEYDALFGNPLMRAKDGNFAADVAERGDTILNMLKSGQADNITDAMLDMGDSVKNTQLNQYLFQNYDLPMDEASRMARAAEMGFEGDFLHGTGSDIAAVDPAKLGEKQNVLGKGFYQTTNPERAERYVPRVTDQEGNRVFAEGGSIMPLMTKSADEFDLTAQTGKENITRIANAFEGSGFDVKLRDGGDSVSIKSKTDPKMSAFLDSYQDGQATLMRLKDAFGNNNITPILQEAGFTGVKGFEGRGSNVRVNYNPQDVRSRFARFDPRLSHLSNLTAANASPLGGLVAQGMVSQEEVDDYLRRNGM